MNVDVLSLDVMDRSRFPQGVHFVRRGDELDGAADTVVVDLARPDALDAVRRLRAEGSLARIVAFGSHVERDLLAEARAAGCDEVLARSEFFGDLAGALGGPDPPR